MEKKQLGMIVNLLRSVTRTVQRRQEGFSSLRHGDENGCAQRAKSNVRCSPDIWVDDDQRFFGS
jgi:hypothetical protein